MDFLLLNREKNKISPIYFLYKRIWTGQKNINLHDQ